MKVTVRKFPFPYQCALAISSDIDNADSESSFIELMTFFNTHKSTVYGNGLNLELGNSFWFYNESGTEQLSYFKPGGHQQSSFAPIIREHWKSGHIDSLHSYGNFDRGGFSRKHAELASEELAKHSISLPVWTNHGIGLNTQKVGGYPEMFGDLPSHDSCHIDITKNLGCEYFWIGKSTHIIGQDARRTLSILGKSFLQGLLKRTKYQHTSMPIFDNHNHLISPITFRDGNAAWEFQRWINSFGGTDNLDFNELERQLTPSILNKLIANQGYMILYTHINENCSTLTNKLETYLHYLRELVNEKKILMATTSRLLKYKEISDYVSFDVIENDSTIILSIGQKIDLPFVSKSLSPKDLQGLTFYVEENKDYRLFMNDTEIPTVTNPPDELGFSSVMIPWEKLEYPL